MATHIIGYDLHPKQGETYSELEDAIKALDRSYWHCLDSTWIIRSDYTAEQVRNLLWQHMRADDQLFVVQIEQKAAAWAGFSDECGGWLKRNL